MHYLLLPFTHGIDEPAITYALSLAHHRGATLILLSLLRLRGQIGKQTIRWEDIQQSTDFLEFTQQKAARMEIPIQRVELRTAQPVQSIRAFAQEMDCQGIILFVRKGAGVLLATQEVKQLLEDRHYPLYVANLPVSKPCFSLWQRGQMFGR
jgi:nucleotide-binding universal stress UspA family protein